MSDIEFVDTVPGRTLRPDIQAAEREFAAALKKNPNRWAKYPLPIVSNVAARAMASKIKLGRRSAFGSGFTATQRHGEVFVKYIGSGQ